jgi:hypothetical protein
MHWPNQQQHKKVVPTKATRTHRKIVEKTEQKKALLRNILHKNDKAEPSLTKCSNSSCTGLFRGHHTIMSIALTVPDKRKPAS